MSFVNPDALVSTEWLAEHLGDADLRVVDATHFAPTAPRDAEVEYEIRHIPGAVRVDIDDVAAVSDPDVMPPHMLPPAGKFAEKVGALGIGNDDRVVVYDGTGGFSAAARVWWMFRIFGHRRVSLLDGGLMRWMREKRPISDIVPQPKPVPYEATFQASAVRSLDQMVANMESRAEQVIDARTGLRFRGEGQEVYPTLHVGHIPGSLSVPFVELMDGKKDFMMRSPGEIAETFARAGVDPGRPIVVTCGSGVTAAVPILALHLLGHDDVAMYDGSWAEWGNREDLPVET